jgi:DNA-binding phage protein
MQIREHVAAVLLEEVKRQRRLRAEVARTAGLNKNALYRLADGATLTVDSLWALTGALDLTMEEFVARVHLRTHGFAHRRVTSNVVTSA